MDSGPSCSSRSVRLAIAATAALLLGFAMCCYRPRSQQFLSDSYGWPAVFFEAKTEMPWLVSMVSPPITVTYHTNSLNVVTSVACWCLMTFAVFRRCMQPGKWQFGLVSIFRWLWSAAVVLWIARSLDALWLSPLYHEHNWGLGPSLPLQRVDLGPSIAGDLLTRFVCEPIVYAAAFVAIDYYSQVMPRLGLWLFARVSVTWRDRRPRWLRPRYSLRALFFALTAVAISVWFIMRCENQRRAIAQIEGKGGNVYFAGEDPYEIDDPRRWSARLKHYFIASPKGVMFFGVKDKRLELLHLLPTLEEVTSLQLPSPDVTNEGIRTLSELPQLKVIQLKNCPQVDSLSAQYCLHLEQLVLLDSAMDNQGLEILLGEHPQLRNIRLPGSKVTDEGLAILPRSRIQILDLSRTAITDRGRKFIHGHPTLGGLNLDQTKLTDANWEGFDVPNLEWLCLEGTDVGDHALESIGWHSKLTELRLGGTLITDRGVQFLENMPQLQRLQLAYTEITDASIPILCRLPNLVELDVHQTSITEAGLLKLSVPPDCELSVSDVSDDGRLRLEAQGKKLKVYVRVGD